MNIVFDLDGTLADCRHRVHFVTGEEKDWDSFYDACIYDEPIKVMIDLLRALKGPNHIEIWTGRPERIRRPTEAWLALHGIRCPVVMRADGDHREDYAVKKEMLEVFRARMHTICLGGPGGGPGVVDLVFEDRQQVVDMYRSHGIIVAQVAEGKF